MSIPWFFLDVNDTEPVRINDSALRIINALGSIGYRIIDFKTAVTVYVHYMYTLEIDKEVPDRAERALENAD